MGTEAPHGGTGNADTANQDGQAKGAEGNEGETPKFVTQEDVTKIVNSAVTNHNKRLEGKLNERFTSFENLLKGINQPSGDTQDDEDNSEDKSPQLPKNSQSAPSPQDRAMKQLQKQIETLQKQLTDEKTAKEQESTKAKENMIRSKVMEVASTLGSDKGHQVYRLLSDRFETDDAGNVKLKVNEDGYEDLRDLKAGLNDFLQSDEGKHFLPPKNFQGSGASSGQAGKSGSGGKTYTVAEIDAMKPSELEKLDIPKLLKEGKIVSS